MGLSAPALVLAVSSSAVGAAVCPTNCLLQSSMISASSGLLVMVCSRSAKLVVGELASGDPTLGL